jgi:hypothetical protein
MAITKQSKDGINEYLISKAPVSIQLIRLRQLKH